MCLLWIIVRKLCFLVDIYLEKLHSGNLTDILNKEQVEDGDVFFYRLEEFIPSEKVY